MCSENQMLNLYLRKEVLKMEDLKLYAINSTELNELIDSKRIELKHKNL